MLKALLLNEEMKVTTINFAIVSQDGETIYTDYTSKELLNIL